MRAKEALKKKITGVRKTRNGNILLELKAKTSASEIAGKIK
jgi:hypothetical protein